MSSFTFAQFAATRRITAFEPAPDGNAVYFVSDISGQFNLWRVSAEGGWPEQLTQFAAESVRDLAVSEDGRQIAFLADPNGSEVYQVYLMAAQSGWPVQVTGLPNVRHSLGCFSPDGRYLAYCANATSPRDMDIYLRDLATGETRQLTPGGRLMYPAWFSPDGTQLLAVQPMSNTNHDLWVIDPATGEGRNVTEHAGRQASYFPGAWRGDSKGFWFFSNDGRDFMAMGYCDLESGQREIVRTADWDMERLAVSHRHGLMASCVNEAGNSRLTVVDVESGQELALPELPKGVVGNLRFAESDERQRLFLSMNCSDQAAAIYVVDLDRQEVRLLTPSMLGNVPADAFASPELVHIAAFDGSTIPAWLYRPHGVGAGERVPALLAVHGGPDLQERPEYRYNGFYQYLLSQGVAVLAPNIRGSTGFGVGWQKQVHRDWGGRDLKDLEACARYLQSLDWVEGSKLAVWGQSYGGFAALSCASRLPGYWACAADFYGPANLVTFAASGPPTWKHVIKSWIGDPEEDREMLVERSPITYADQIKCPLLVVQGATDTRVVRAESDQMVERLRALGREVEYVVFEDEGHGFARRANQLRAFELLSTFLLRHLIA